MIFTCIAPICAIADETAAETAETVEETAAEAAATTAKTAAKTEEDAETLSKAKVLIELGIIKSYKAGATLTKSTAVGVLDKVTGSNVMSGKFVNENYKDGEMTAVQAASMMVELAGHTTYMKAMFGSYNDSTLYGYAKKIGVLSGVKAKLDEVPTMADFVNMVYNTLFKVDMIDTVGWSGITEYTKHEDLTAAYRYMDIVTLEGVVYGSGKLNLTTTGELNPENIRIDNHEYIYKAFDDPETIVGRYVKAYLDAKSGDTIKAMRVVDKKNSVLELESDDIMFNTITEREIPYYDKNDKNKTAYLASSVNVVYNGELVPFYDKEDLTNEDANYTLIDNNDDGNYEIVFISKYTPILVWRVSNGSNTYTVQDYNNTTYCFDDYYHDGYVIVDESGKATTWRDVGQYDVLSLRVTKSGEYNKILHSIKKVNGKYKKSTKDMKRVTIDDTEYKTTVEFKNNSLMLSKLKLGDEITAFFDVFDRVVGAIPYKAADGYAAIMDFGGSNDMEGYQIKYLAQTGQVIKTKLNDTIKINGSKVTAEKAVKGKSNLLFKTDGTVKQQVVELKTNGKGYVTSIDTADESKLDKGEFGNDKLTLNMDRRSSSMAISSVNGTLTGEAKYVFDSDTIKFTVYTNNDEKCSVGTVGSGDCYGMMYNIDNDYHVGIVATYGTQKFYESGWVNVNSDMILVESTAVVAHPHKEGEIAYAVYGWKDGKRETWICEDGDFNPGTNKYNYMAWVYGNKNDKAFATEVENVWMKTKWSEIPQGSVISVVQNEGLVTKYSIQYLGGNEHVFEQIEDNTQNGAVMVGSWAYGVTKTLFCGPALHAFGVVQQVNRFGFVINNHYPSTAEGGIDAFPIADWNRTIPYGASSRVYIVNSDARNDIEVGTIADIRVGDKIYTRHKEGSTDVVVVYH